MNPPESEHTTFVGRPEGLARLLTVGERDAALWAPEELQAMWRHQLAAPIEADLSTGHWGQTSPLKRSPQLEPFLAKCFAELFDHPQPPLELLKRTKDFAKQTIDGSEEQQLNEIARALYYASYAAALTRCHARIGAMGDEKLALGFDWALRQTWLDERTKALIGEARDLLGAKGKI